MTAVPGSAVEIPALIERRYNILLFSQQDSLGGHGNSAETAPAITQRFTNQDEFHAAHPFAKISAQMSSSNCGRIAIGIVFFINLPPWVKDRAWWRLFQQSQEIVDYLGGHRCT